MIDRAKRAADRFRDRPGVLAAGLLLAAAAMLLLGGASPSSSSNCFQGVFAKDPVHCQVLVKAYNEDVLDIAAMYEGGAGLHVLINNDRSEYEDIDAFVRQHAKAAVQAGDPIEYCYEGEWWQDYCAQEGTLVIADLTLLPPSERYEEIILYPGGESALQGISGWASFKKLWPRSDAIFARAQRASSSSSPTGPFDITGLDFTGLDLTNLDDCSRFSTDLANATSRWESGWCDRWLRYPGAGFVGEIDTRSHPQSTYYVQIKTEPGKLDEAIARARAAMPSWALAGPDDPDYGSISDGRSYVVPVKYDFGELWRWRTLLRRFAKLPGNRIGIAGAKVHHNLIHPRPEIQFFVPGSGVKPARKTDKWFSTDPVTYRTTINVYSHDPQATLQGLPKLLEQLNIPADAVGVVIDDRYEAPGVAVPEI